MKEIQNDVFNALFRLATENIKEYARKNIRQEIYTSLWQPVFANNIRGLNLRNLI